MACAAEPMAIGPLSRLFSLHFPRMPESPRAEADGSLDLSVVAPAHNEEGNILDLVAQVGAALEPTGLAFEFIIVDDGSTDRTCEHVTCLLATRPWLRCVGMTRTPPGNGNGQSAAFHAGFRAARGRVVATLDADLQNDPGEIPLMLEHMRKTGADLVQGDRSHARKDNVVRRVGSRVGRLFRNLLLADVVRDTGCSLRVMRREIALALPLEFRGMHRFIPITAVKLGYRVEQMPVCHRPRVAGQTKYGLGIWQRSIPGLIDCFAVRWMADRRRPISNREIPSPTSAGDVEVEVVTRSPSPPSRAEARA